MKDDPDLISYVSQKGPDSKVDVVLIRDGKRLQRTVQLGERPTGEEADAEEGGGNEPSGIEWLGLEYQDLTPSLRKSHGVPDDLDGVLVADVAPSSPLFEEGVREGDVITEVNGAAGEERRAISSGSWRAPRRARICASTSAASTRVTRATCRSSPSCGCRKSARRLRIPRAGREAGPSFFGLLGFDPCPSPEVPTAPPC